MPTGRSLKNRIKSTKNIRQMTRAMEAVSAVKMRRSIALALSARPYAIAALSILESIENTAKREELQNLSPLLTKHSTGKNAIVVVASDRGLVGSFNASVLKKADAIRKSIDNPCIIAIGKKAGNFFRKNGGVEMEFDGTGDYGAINEVSHLEEYLVRHFTSGEFKTVTVIYMNFVSALKQDTIVRELLPFRAETIRKLAEDIIPERGKYANTPKSIESPLKTDTSYQFEPNPKHVLDTILPALLRFELYEAILEANASEHSSRMLAMKQASDNAKDLITDLTRLYNKSRQASITKELTEITAGREALEA